MYVKQNTVLVYNIPNTFHSKHLRRFFHSSIEANAFKCFHFRHRKAGYISSTKINFEPDTYTCIIKLMKESLVEEFYNTYNNSKWLQDGITRCKIFSLHVNSNSDESKFDPNHNKTLDLDDLYPNKVKMVAEMKPSKLLKHGNVGTPLSHFMQLIRDCRLPSSLLTKLGIHLQVLSMKQNYTSIPWSYIEPHCVTRNFTKDIESQYIRQVDDEEEEEWDRYAMVNDDPYKLVPKERHFEQKTEVVWEKGGPGLVWHMDINYWEQFEEEAEREVDDWDVDFEEGDFRDNPVLKDTYRTFKKKDTNTRKPYIRSNVKSKLKETKENPSLFINLRSMMTEIDSPTFKNTFDIRESRKDSNAKKKSLIKLQGKMGCFGEYSNHFGSKIMKKYGWEKGTGLGQGADGIKETILADGQSSTDKSGFGYKGNKTFSSHIKT